MLATKTKKVAVSSKRQIAIPKEFFAAGEYLIHKLSLNSNQSSSSSPNKSSSEVGSDAFSLISF